MTKFIYLFTSVTLMAGLTAACGQNAATAEDRAQIASETRDLEENTFAANQALEAADTVQAAAPATTETVTAATAAAPTAAPEKAANAKVSALPLKRGFYVASDTPCGSASNATLRLVTRDGMSGSRDICTFNRIEKIGATSYRAAEKCSGGGVSTTTYEVPNDTSFTARYEGGSESSARYCNQSSLPDPWHDNDISDLTG